MDEPTIRTSHSRAPLPALTSIRFFAALWVVVLHAASVKEAVGDRLFTNSLANNLALTGYCGVGLFFLLSGFILTYNYIDFDLRGTSLAKYRVARFARIFPLDCVGLALVLPLMIHSLVAQEITIISLMAFVSSLILCVLLIQGWIPQAALRWNGPGWSLSVEAFFYGLFPFCLCRLRNCNTRILLIMLLGLQTAALIPPLLASSLSIEGLSNVSGTTVVESSNWPNFFKFFPVFRLPEFIFGIVIGVLYCRHATGAILRRSAFAMTLCGTATVFGVCMFAAGHISYIFLHNGLLLVPFTAVLLGLAQNQSFFAKLLSHKWLEILGCASYSLYIIHLPMIEYFGAVANRLGVDFLGNAPTSLACLAMTVGFSILLWRFVEEPARSRIMRIWQERGANRTRTLTVDPPLGKVQAIHVEP